MADDPKPLDLNPTFQELQILRANAIEGYAQCEQALCRLFGNLLGTPLEIGAIVFYRITNTHSRNRIIEELLSARHGTEYEAYWHGIPNTPNRSGTGMFAIIRQLDQSRNEIVHWHFSAKIEEHGAPSQRTLLGLMKPAAWPLSFDPDERTISVFDLFNFSAKAGFVARSLTMFYAKLTGGLEPPHVAHATWQEIFSQPASYPPSDTHPLFLNPQAPDSPPQS